MKKQLMKTALLTAAVMGAMTFNSCKENENEVVPPVQDGPKTDIAIGIRMAGKQSSMLKSALTQDNVNMGTEKNDIANMTIVPMVGDAVQHPIVLGTFEKNKTTLYKEATVLQSVNGFRVYGNLPDDVADENKNFSVGEALTLQASTDNKDSEYSGTLYAPHAMYYYKEVKANDSDFKVAKGTVAGDWDTLEEEAWSTCNGAIGAENNRIKIEKVGYGVGVFAAGVLVDLTYPDSLIFYQGDDYTAEGAKKYSDVIDAAQGKTIDITGMIIDGQTKTFADDFTRKGTDVAKVFAAATKDTILEQKIGFKEGTPNDVAIIEGANIYSIVAPEEASTVSLNFQFQNNTEYSFDLNDGTTVKAGDYFYMPVTISRQQNQDIFEAATSTLINATVREWGRATLTPVESTEVEIGITIDMDWKKGVAYDVDL